MRKLSKYYLVLALVAALAVGCGSDEVSENDQQNVEQNQNDPEQNDPEQNQNDPEQNQNDPEQNQNDPEENQNDPEENQNDPEENQNDPEENQNDPEENQEEGEPELEISGEEALSWTLEIGMSEAAQFEIGNVGDAALEFDVFTGEEWLRFDPETGEVDDGEQLTVEAEATCPDEVGDYAATVTVSSDGGDAEFDAEVSCEPLMPGTLEVVVEGLPEFQDADISIEGPDGFAEDVVETAVFDEAPVGAYTVTAREVGEDAVYVPESTEETVEVERDGDSSVTIEYEPVLGGVLVDVEGLPSGAEPDLTLVQNGEEWDVPDNGLLQEMVPGDYTLSGDDYEDGGTLYEASDTAVTIISDEVVDATISYLIDPGYLEVDVSGLPQGASHEIDVVADSDGEVTELPSSGELTLEPDTYYVEPKVVNAGLADYDAEGETVVIESGELVEVDVDYEVILGQLPVVIDELPAGADAEVTLTLVGDTQAESVTETTTLTDLVPGTYEIEIDDVDYGPATYEGSGPAEVDVSSDDNDPLTINYDVMPGELVVQITGDLDGVAPHIEIEGPDFDETIDEETTEESFDGLLPGDYELTVHDVSDNGVEYLGDAGADATVTVESGTEPTTATVDYSVVPGDLPVVIDELPAEADAEVTLSSPEHTEEVTESTTVTGLPPGTYDVEVDDVEHGPANYIGSGPAEVVVDSGENDPLEIDYEVVPGELVVEITGDLDDVAPHIDIEGPDFNATIDTETTQETFTNVLPGDYDLTVYDVSDNGTDYLGDAGADATVTVESGTEATTATVNYEVVLAELPVTIGGDLPGGVNADVDLSADEHATKVVESGTVELVPGTYDIDVNEVDDGDITSYRAMDDAPMSVTVESGSNDPLEIDYELIPATLNIEVTGELGGNDADVRIHEPGSSIRTATGDDSFDDLVPGEYTVEARDVDDGPATYEGSGGETLTLESGDNETVSVEYELITGDIIVTVDEIGDVDYEVELMWPDGSTEPITSDVSYSGEEPGDYEVVVVTEPEDPFGNESYIDIAPPDFTLESGDEQNVDIEVRAANIVTTESDSGEGSLRYVVNDVAPETTVEFIDDVSEIVFTGGQIVIDKDLRIEGDSEAPVILNGDDANRLFRVNSGGEVILVDLELRNGFGEPGGAVRIVDDGELLVGGVVFRDNTSSSVGGAVLVEDDGHFYAEDSLFVGNIAEHWGAAVATRSGDDTSSVYLRRSLIRDNISNSAGGAVDTNGELHIEHSTFVNNESDGFAAAIVVYDGDAILEGLTVVENGGNATPDGIYAGTDSEVILRNSIVADNDDGDLRGTLSNFISNGFNVIGEVGEEFEAHQEDQLDVEEPGLEALADNGGFTDTMALTEESTARSVMFGGQCYDTAELFAFRDQRGERRPAGAFCSAGAIELDTTNEPFDGADMSRHRYQTDSFEGTGGIEWEHYRVKRQEEDEDDDDYIEGTSVVLHGDDEGWIAADGIPGGVSSISMMLAQATTASGPRQVEVYINGEFVAESDDIADTGDGSRPYPPTLFSVNLEALGHATEDDFDLEIRSSGGEHVTVDNVNWR